MILETAALSFTITFFLIYFYRQINLEKKFCIGTDINKKNQPVIPEGTGITLVPGVFASIFLAFSITPEHIPELGLLAGTITLFSVIGFFDDMKNKFAKKSLGWLTRAVPIAAISFLFGFFVTNNLFYAFIFGAFLAATASFQNTFAGLNGWEVGSGVIISLFLTMILSGTYLFYPAVGLSAAVFALLLFNFYPAKVFPGDTGTLFIGSAIGALALLSKDPKIIILTSLFFLPHIIDFFFLKMLTNAKDMTQQKTRPYALLKDNKLDIPDRKNPKLDFAKLVIKIFGPMHEKKIVRIILLVVLANCTLWITVFHFIGL